MISVPHFYNLYPHDAFAILEMANPPENYLKRPAFIEPGVITDFLSVNQSRALIVKGSGRHFSAGGDLDEIRRMAASDKLAEALQQGNTLLSVIESLEIPAIAAIDGVCFGGGLEVALACHIRIASSNALFALPETNHGLIPGLGGLVRLARRDHGLAARIALSGQVIDAEKALSFGLVDELSPKSKSFDAALTLAHQLTDDRSLKVINYTLRVLHCVRQQGETMALELEARLFADLALEADFNTINP